jgi:hypothetical protein
MSKGLMKTGESIKLRRRFDDVEFLFENLKTIRQTLASINVQEPEISLMTQAYFVSVSDKLKESWGIKP